MFSNTQFFCDTRESHSFLQSTEEPGPRDVITKEFYEQPNYKGPGTYSLLSVDSWPETERVMLSPEFGLSVPQLMGPTGPFNFFSWP